MQLLKFISCVLIFVVYHSINAQRLTNAFDQLFVQANATDQGRSSILQIGKI
ncbi:MAG: hypothetical protein IPH98_00370 [Saprospiraceae bacterium]|nr:hypothetical protein [Candidatus Defluviibacterium haderslevense]